MQALIRLGVETIGTPGANHPPGYHCFRHLFLAAIERERERTCCTRPGCSRCRPDTVLGHHSRSSAIEAPRSCFCSAAGLPFCARTQPGLIVAG